MGYTGFPAAVKVALEQNVSRFINIKAWNAGKLDVFYLHKVEARRTFYKILYP